MGGGGSKYHGPDVYGARSLNRDFKKIAEDAQAKAKKQAKNNKAKAKKKPVFFGGVSKDIKKALKNVKMKPKKK
jgi:hypothetical protein